MWDDETDIIIVGAGFAGLSAAVTARKLGQSVLLVEKMPKSGGNSILAPGGINAVDPARQEPQGIMDSIDLHFKHTFEGGDSIGDPEKIRFMVNHAFTDAIGFTERLGVVWSPRIVRGYGALWERTHFSPSYRDKTGNSWRNGAALVQALLDRLQELNQGILLNHSLVRILRESQLAGKVLGVEVETDGTSKTLRARRGVIMASGGFAANLAWVTKHDRRLTDTDTTNHRGATGECIKIAEDIGADTLHMDYIQAIPGPVQKPFLAMFFQIETERLRSSGMSMPYCIFVNQDGKRFVDEGARRDVVKAAAIVQPRFEPFPTVHGDTIAELEQKLHIPVGALCATVESYNAYCQTGQDLEFGKDPSVLVPLAPGPFYGRCQAMQRHHTMGGLVVHGSTGQVIDRWGQPIPHLFAAGEVTGGTHGANRLGHNSIPDCLVFGQRCARVIASLSDQDQSPCRGPAGA